MFGLITQNRADRERREAVDAERRDGDRRVKETRDAREDEVKRLNSAHEIEKNEILASHKIELAEKEFTITHTADERVKKADDARVAAETKLQVSEKENEMLHKIVDDRADVLEIKDLVKDLLAKIPEIKIDTLAVSSNQKAGGDGSKQK